MVFALKFQISFRTPNLETPEPLKHLQKTLKGVAVIGGIVFAADVGGHLNWVLKSLGKPQNLSPTKLPNLLANQNPPIL